MNKLADLEKLADFKKRGIITSEEFEEQKKRLLLANLKTPNTQTVRTERNLAESIFLFSMGAVFILCILSAFGTSPETYSVIHFIIFGFLFPVDVVLFIVALCLKPFVIRARYFAYFLLLTIVLAMIEAVIDYIDYMRYIE